MATDYIKCYGNLQQELDNAKHTLVALNDNIRRIIGRHPKDLRNEKHKAVYTHETKRTDGDRQGPNSSELSKFKRRSYDTKSVFNRLSAPASRSGDEEPRPRLNSRVIRELPTRQEIVEAQGIDSESRARNRRMFGSLLGTLHKFCQEESRLKQKEDKKAQIEKKLEEQELQERETMKRERELLFVDRKRKQLEIRKLEIKMNRLKDFEIWESSMVHLRNHIKTKSKPHLYYKPSVMCKKTEKLLTDSQASMKKTIESKRDALNTELADLENNCKIHEFEIDDQFYSVGNNESSVADETFTNKELDVKVERQNLVALDVTPRKADLDSKENKFRNFNEPALSSSVVVVNNAHNEIFKMQ